MLLDANCAFLLGVEESACKKIWLVPITMAATAIARLGIVCGISFAGVAVTRQA
jgi:hypothetical protein